MKNIYYVVFMGFIGLSCTTGYKNTVRYSGEDISKVFSIVRDKNTKAASLQVGQDGKWSLYVGNSVETIDLSDPIVKGEKAGAYSLPVSDSVRSYFFLETEEGTAILSERHLPMTGGYNFRDMGGLRNKEGRFVKWGKVFRSDGLHELTDADLIYLDHIPLRSVVDFRSLPEIEQEPDKLPASASGYQLSISPGSLNAETMKEAVRLTPDQTETFMMDMNRSFSTDPAIVNQYRTFFQMLQDETKTPLLFHCTAGKDRTGMAGALFLYALGVDDEVIMNDYLSSNIYLNDKYAGYMVQYPNLRPLFEVKREFIQSGIEQIRQDHGSVDDYLVKVLHVDIDKMKSLYLYK